jgi:hypothetical protein
MFSWLGRILRDPEKRAVFSWLGGGIAIVASGTFAVFTFVVDHKDARDKKSGTSPELVAQIQKPLADELAAQRAQIENLTKMLLEKNPAAAAPGARQAVAEAVGSIAQGAAEGDPRLKQALALLKENKVGEATHLPSLHGDIFVKSLLSMPASFCRISMFGVRPLAVAA